MSTSYTDETVRAKLSALNDSQDSIVAVAQWIMFHRYEPRELGTWVCAQTRRADNTRRQAKRSTELWFERLKESSPHRKLMLIYLANGVSRRSALLVSAMG